MKNEEPRKAGIRRISAVLLYNFDMDKISFIILTWNSEKVILPCLKSIYEIQDPLYEIIMVDNGSSDGTIPMVRQFFSDHPDIKAEIIQLEKNYGTTISRNLGIQKVSEESNYVCILDSDTVINQGAMKELIGVLSENKENGIAGPYMVNLSGEEQVTAKKIPNALLKIRKAMPVKSIQKKGEIQEKYNFTAGKRSYPVGYLISACWMIRRELIQNIGTLDEKIFYSPEDVEYCVRAWQNGYRVLYCPNAKIIHATQRISKKKLVSRHNWEHIKGLIYFFYKYGLFKSSEKIICK